MRRNMRLMRTLPIDEGSRTVAFEPLGTVTGANRKASCDIYEERQDPDDGKPAARTLPPGTHAATIPCGVDTLERQDAGKSLCLISG